MVQIWARANFNQKNWQNILRKRSLFENFLQFQFLIFNSINPGLRPSIGIHPFCGTHKQELRLLLTVTKKGFGRRWKKGKHLLVDCYSVALSL